MKSWYRSVLLDDDNGIDRIQRNLRRQGQRLPNGDESATARKAVAAALSYMRESTCWQMQQRVKPPVKPPP